MLVLCFAGTLARSLETNSPPQRFPVPFLQALLLQDRRPWFRVLERLSPPDPLQKRSLTQPLLLLLLLPALSSFPRWISVNPEALSNAEEDPYTLSILRRIKAYDVSAHLLNTK